ncbi:dihydropyrimidinase-related protein 5-like [Tachypleus tridentatus]|uniref:dihydropyrimidinase-related protein 5-like n=1 Tax=Tachypleus tridentatus TaxID=6853 RepID=UPI003FCF755F
MCANDFNRIPHGMNGVEDRLSVVWEKVVIRQPQIVQREPHKESTNNMVRDDIEQ